MQRSTEALRRLAQPSDQRIEELKRRIAQLQAEQAAEDVDPNRVANLVAALRKKRK